MSTPDKCPHCGNPVKSDIGAGDVLYGCWTASQHLDSPSDRCRERTAHAETRKRAELFENQLKHAISQCDFWERRCDEKDAEIKREREKWEKLRAWAGAYSHRVIALWEMNRLDAEAKEGQR